MKVVYAIPGLGTTRELFEKVNIPGFELKVLDWPTPSRGKSLGEYAHEFIGQINITNPVNLLGVSFGGMICMELAQKIRTDKVVLVSSCKNKRELPPLIRAMEYIPAYKIFSERQHRFIASKTRKIIGFERHYLPVFRKMIYEMPPHYFSYCMDMIVKWDRKEATISPFHIHGDRDRLLLHRYINNCHTIRGGTHAMIVNKADEINKILAKVYNG